MSAAQKDCRLDLVGPLCDAALRGDINALKELVKNGANVNRDVTPHDLRSALHFAAAGGRMDCVKYLVEEAGAKLQPDAFGMLPIHDAVINNHPVVRAYLQQLQVNTDLGVVANPDNSRQEQMERVYGLIVKEGIFSHYLVRDEVLYFYGPLGFDPKYFEHFTPAQIARHVHLLIAAKRGAQASDSRNVTFQIEKDQRAFYLTTIGDEDINRNMVKMVSNYLQRTRAANQAFSLTYMLSDGPVFKGGDKRDRLSCYIAEQVHYETDATEKAKQETDLQLVASPTFLLKKSPTSQVHYQRLIDACFHSKHPIVEIHEGSQYPATDGRQETGFVVQFAVRDVTSRNFVTEIFEALRYSNNLPRRYYVETFINGITSYVFYFPQATKEDVSRFADALKYVIFFKTTPNRSGLVFNLLQKGLISPELSCFMLSLVRFSLYFFPREQVLERYLELPRQDRNKLDALYSYERIYDVATRHFKYIKVLFDDFTDIAHGKKEPQVNTELLALMDAEVHDSSELALLRCTTQFNESIRMSNFFKKTAPGAVAYRFDPEVLLKNRPKQLLKKIF